MSSLNHSLTFEWVNIYISMLVLWIQLIPLTNYELKLLWWWNCLSYMWEKGKEFDFFWEESVQNRVNQSVNNVINVEIEVINVLRC